MSKEIAELEIPLEEFLAAMNAGQYVPYDSVIYRAMERLSSRARWITNYLNNVPHSPDIVHGIVSELIQYPIDPSVNLLPPYYTGVGVNTRFGYDVQIGQGCHFEDQGGISIGDGCIIDADVLICTLTRDAEISRRKSVLPSPVVLCDNVWIGARTTILPGVTVGTKAVVLPGSVVMYDVLPGTIFGGVPAQYLRDN